MSTELRRLVIYNKIHKALASMSRGIIYLKENVQGQAHKFT
jgi:hypothetical protein